MVIFFLTIGVLLIVSHANLVTLQSSCANCTINVPTTYTFNFLRNINPVNGSIQTPATLDIGSYIQITFPASYPVLSNGAYTCNSSTGTALSCAMSSNVLTVNGYYNSSTIGNSAAKLTVDGVTNPIVSGNSGEFQYGIYNSQGQLVDQSAPTSTTTLKSSSVVLVSASFASCSITTTGSTSVTSTVTVTLTPTNPIPSSGSLLVTFPPSWANDPLTGASIPGSVSCQPLQTVVASITCSLSTSNTVLVTGLYTSAINSQFSFVLNGILMPPTTSSSDTISIQSQTVNGNVIDSCTTQLVGVVPNTILTTSMRNTVTTVGLASNTTISFPLINPMQITDTIVLGFAATVQTPTGVQSISPFSLFGVTTNTTSNQVVIGNFTLGSSFLPSGTTITINLVNMTNPLTTLKYSVSVTIYRNSLSVQTGTVSNKATTNTLSFVLTPSVNTTGSNPSCILSVNTSTQLLPNSYMVLQYPGSIEPTVVTTPLVSSCKLGSSSVLGCSYSLSSTYLKFTQVFGSAFPSGNIQINFSQLTNPGTVQPQTYTLSTYSSDGSIVDTGVFTLTVSPSLITGTLLQSQNYTVLSSSTLSLNFVSTIPFNMVSITLPSDITISPTVTQTCTGISMSSCTYSNFNLSFTSISPVTGAVSLSWGRNTMPNSFQPTSQFTVTTFYNGWVVSITNSYIGLTMNTSNVFTSSNFVLSPTINSGSSSLTLNFTLPTSAPSGYLYLSIPPEVTIQDSPICSLNFLVVACYKSQNSIITQIVNTSITNSLVIQNLTNPPTSASTPTPVRLTLTNPNNFSSLSSDLGPITNTLPSALVCQVSNNTGFLGQVSLLAFTGTLVGGQSNITIIIPTSFPPMLGSPCPTCTLINSYSFSYPSLSSATTFSFSVNLSTPTSNSSSGLFTVSTFTTAGASVQSGTTNWTPKCVGTTCRDCSGTQCLNCYLSPISTFNLLSNGNCTETCPIGNFVVGTTCYACDSSCKNCINTSTTCTQCAVGSYLNSINDSCSGVCPDTYFPDPSSGKCIGCQLPCLKCTLLTSCLSCQTGYLSGTSCVLSCPTGVTVPNDQTKNCDKCGANCLTCQNFTFTCTSCNSSIPLYLSNSQCVSSCDLGLYPVNGVCTPCQLPCLTCYNSSTSCLTCDPSSPTPLFFNYKCISQANCSLGYYVNLANSSCNGCPAVCSSCTSASNCTSCVTGLVLSQGFCVTSCPNNTYEVSRICYPCINNCATCSSATVCLSCLLSTYFYQGSCVNSCPSTTYLDSLNCTACTGCLTCLNSTYCLSCIPGQYLYKSTCYTECPSGSYLDNTGCTSCPPLCVNCSSPTLCFSCVTGYSLENSSCVQTCSRGLSYNGVCFPCGLNCDICGPTACLLCSDLYNLYQGFCISSCPQTTLPVAKVCQLCSTVYSDCLTCNSSQCLSCSSGILINTQCTTCPTGKYPNLNKCSDCPSQCTICTNSTSCFACSQGYFYYDNFCISNCPVNTIMSGMNCMECAPNCSKCDQDSTKCTVCNSGFLVYQGGCTSSCPDGYLVSLNQSNCIDKAQFYKEYSSSSKPIYFPFAISALILLLVILICKLKLSQFHYFTLAVSLISVIELCSWALLLTVSVLNYYNGHQESILGLICLAIALSFGVCANLVHLAIYYRYFKKDLVFFKWIQKHNHHCSTVTILSVSSVCSFKVFRLCYSKFFNKSNLSLQLCSVNSLKPVNMLSLVSFIFCSAPALTGSGLAMYFSVGKDQQFWVGMDTLVVTIATCVLMLIDMYHPANYFEEGDALKVKYQADDINSDMQIQMQAEEGKDASRYRDLPFEARELDSHLQLLDHSDYDATKMWVSVDPRGYKITQLPDGSMKYYNSSGYEVRTNGDTEELYDQQGYRVIANQSTGQFQRFDGNGYRIVFTEDGVTKKYNKLGYLVETNRQTGEDEMFNEGRYKVILDADGQAHYFDQQGDQVYVNKIGMYVKMNPNASMKTMTNEEIEGQDQENEMQDDHVGGIERVSEGQQGQQSDVSVNLNTDFIDVQEGNKQQQQVQNGYIVETIIENQDPDSSRKQVSDKQEENIDTCGFVFLDDDNEGDQVLPPVNTIPHQDMQLQAIEEELTDSFLEDFVEKTHRQEPVHSNSVHDIPCEQKELSYEQPPSVQDVNLSQKTMENQGVEAGEEEFLPGIQDQEFQQDYLQSQSQGMSQSLAPECSEKNVEDLDPQTQCQKKQSFTLQELAQQVLCIGRSRQGNYEQEKVRSHRQSTDELNSVNTAEWQKTQEEICPVYDTLRHELPDGDYLTLDEHRQATQQQDPTNPNYQNNISLPSFDIDNSRTSTIKKSPKKDISSGIKHHEELLFQQQFRRKRRGFSGLPNPLIECAREISQSVNKDKGKSEQLEKMYFQPKTRPPKSARPPKNN